MCGRYVSTSSVADLAEAFGVDDVRTGELPVRYNVAPTQPVYAIVSVGGRRRLGALSWGLVPSWAADARVGAKMINARAETVATKPAFRSALLRRRCILPADAFYEWQAPAGGGRGAKQPWAIRRADGRPMAFAGLWETWRDPADPDAEVLRSATIITTGANDTLAGIHHRMPVVLGDETVPRWLDPACSDADELASLLVPAPSGGWATWPVGTRVNAVANDDAGLLAEAAPGP